MAVGAELEDLVGASLRTRVDGEVIERTTHVMEEEGLSSGHLTAAPVERAHQEHKPRDGR